MASVPRLIDIDNDQIGAELETLNVIIEKLPEKDENKKTLDELIERSDRLRKAQIDAVDIQPPEDLPLDHDKFWQAYDEACERAIQRQSDLQKEFNTFDSKVLAFSKKVVHHADELRKGNEAKARIADRTSLVLYTLGLFLGLLGEFYGWGSLKQTERQSALETCGSSRVLRSRVCRAKRRKTPSFSYKVEFDRR